MTLFGRFVVGVHDKTPGMPVCSPFAQQIEKNRGREKRTFLKEERKANVCGTGLLSRFEEDAFIEVIGRGYKM